MHSPKQRMARYGHRHMTRLHVLALLVLYACGSSDAQNDAAPIVDGDTDSLDAGAADALAPCATDGFTGLGTSESPYLLCDGALLLLLPDDEALLGAVYTMDRDIVTPDGFASIGPVFAGTLSGKGHEISGLGSESAAFASGLFATIGVSASVADLRVSGFIDTDVSNNAAPGAGLLAASNLGEIRNVAASGTLRAPNHAGLLVGINGATGSIERCETSGSVQVVAHAGGVVGRNFGSIKQCASSAVVSGVNRQGGLVGTQEGTIEESLATGSVTGTGVEAGCLVGSFFGGSVINSAGQCAQVEGNAGAGGLIGGSSSDTLSIANCYAWTLSIVASSSSGGLVGAGLEVPTSSSYWNSDVSASSAGGTPLTQAQLVEQSSFVGWDFATVWSIADQSPPTLRWREGTAPGF